MITLALDNPSTKEWQQGWKLILASLIGFGFYSVLIYSMGLFMGPLSDEFGWSRSQISTGMSISAILSIPLSPVVGAMIDRWGSRKLALPGLILMTGAISALSITNGSLTQWWVLWTICALCGLGVKATIWIAAVSGVFTTSRGLALAIVMTGAAFAQIIVPPTAQWLIAEFGWRLAWIGLALGWGVPSFILSYLFLFDAHDRKRNSAQEAEKVAPPDLEGLTVKQAARDRNLWLIAGSTIIMMMLTVGVLVHQVPLLTDVGLSREDAAWLASISGIGGIVGKLVTGYLMDRSNPNFVGGATMGVASLGFLFLMEPFRSMPVIVGCAFIIGYSSGAKLQITAFLTGRYAGMKHFGTIFGVMSSLITVGSAIGPFLAGAIYDHYGSYDMLLNIGVVGALCAGTALTILGKQPDWSVATTAKAQSS